MSAHAIDFTVAGGGTIYLVTPHTPEAQDWTAEHIGDDAQWLGRGFAVEHRYIEDILEGMVRDGMTVSGNLTDNVNRGWVN